MINQIRAVIWKEWQELFQQRGLRGAMFNWLVLVGVGGVFVPLQSKSEWFTNPLYMIVWAWIPMLAVMQIVTDTFAGERERHTLETLLASRLSDSAILWGKVLSVVLYGWSIQFGSLIVAAVVVNIAAWQGSLQFYSLTTLLGLIPLIMLLVVLIAAIGTLISLRSASMRAAYQKMMIGFMVIVFGGSALIQFLPGQANLLNSLQDLKLSSILIAVLVVLVVDWGLLKVGTSRFKRETLISQL